MNQYVLDEILDELADRVAARLASRPPARAHEDHEDGWRLLTADEAAAVLGRSRRWIDDAVAKRGLPYIRVDSRRMFDPRDLQAWARSRRVPGAGR